MSAIALAKHGAQKHSHGEIRGEMLSQLCNGQRVAQAFRTADSFFLYKAPQVNPRSHRTLSINLVASWHRLEALRLLAAAAAAVPGAEATKKGPCNTSTGVFRGSGMKQSENGQK